MPRSLEPRAAWNAVELGFAEILDLRTQMERRRHGAPPGARPVSLVSHVASPEGQERAADPSVAGSAPISDDLRTKVQAAIDAITVAS